MIVSLVVALALTAPVTDSTPPAAVATPPAAVAPPPAAPPAAQAPAATPPAGQPMAPPPSAPPAVVPPAPPSVPPAPPSQPPPPPAPPVAATLAAAPPALPPRQKSFPPAHPFHLALGLGVATASGNASQHVAMSDRTAEQFDVLFEIGTRIAQRFYLDAYVELGEGDAAGALADCKSCAVVRTNVGLEAKYAFTPTGRFNPWVGIGGGIEAMSLDFTYESPSTARTTYTVLRYHGVELPRLSAGVDWRINRVIGVGLFACFSFARYSELSGLGETVSISGGEHTWFTVGARGILFP